MIKELRISVFILQFLLYHQLGVSGFLLHAYISQHGLHGEISFLKNSDNTVTVTTNLETTLQYPEQVFSWGIHQYPVDYGDVDAIRRCDLKKIGERIIDFDDELGQLTIPGFESGKWQSNCSFIGDKGIWGKSLVLRNVDDNTIICSTIVTPMDVNVEHLAEARFHTPFAGSIFFRWITDPDFNSDTLIHTNLYHVKDPEVKSFKGYTQHVWKIFVTDIFDYATDKTIENCNILQLVFDPRNHGSGKSIGDIDSRLGKINIATDVEKKGAQMFFRDKELTLLPSDISGPSRQLYVVVYDIKHPDTFLGCAKIRQVQTKDHRVFINQHGIKGEVTMKQRSRFEPTWLNFTMGSSDKSHEGNIKYASDVSAFEIDDLPPDYLSTELNNNVCTTCGSLYNPLENDLSKQPPPGYGTQEQYALGDLSGKHQSRSKNYPHHYYLPGKSSELSGIYWDIFLPLEGKYSIAHRSLIVKQYNRTDGENVSSYNWLCGTITPYEPNTAKQLTMFTAQVLFRYPIVGRVLLRQSKEEPWADTSVLIEYLIHADGSTQEDTNNHRWAIHLSPPGKDFYDWQNRCISTGEVYNPYKVTFNMEMPEKTCSPQYPEKCRLGDLWNRVKPISIAGNKANAKRQSRMLITDANLPLTGRGSIIGKSLTIYDDFGPKARGERLACSKIGGYYKRKAVARDWFANGVPLNVTGKLEITQQSEYELSNVEVVFKGLDETSGYHVHITPVEGALEFPCEASSLYDHWNPRKINAKESPPPRNGTTDQYEMGDLSGKFGTLDGLTQYRDTYNDTDLPLFGYNSIIGRSIIIHKKKNNLRWACSSIERGYSPSEAREIRAIASFHHPYGYAYGYMRFTQLIHSDGSQSDTIIEVKLRHPGEHDRNVTYDHDWNIFVNPVGVDGTVKQTATRCVAGGYVWNPYYTQLADPLNTDLYDRECGPDNPLRCYVGDVSARIGTIDIGNKRMVLTDTNFPLEGDQSAVGRSIVIFSANRSRERYACANIEPDHDIVKYVNLQKPPRFVVSQFLEDIRSVMGLPEWMLEIDTRKTKVLHNNACIQLLLHFKGPRAHQAEIDLSGLLGAGRLDRPTLFIHGYVNSKRKTKISYRTCSVNDPNEKKTQSSKNKFFASFNRNAGSRLYIDLYSISTCIILALSYSLY